MRVVSAVLALLGLAMVFVGPAQAAPPPVSAFSRLPAVQQAAISPDGKRIAILGGQPDKRIIALSPLDGSPPTIIELGDADIKAIRWATNDHLLATIGLFSPEQRSRESYHPAYTYYRDIVIHREGETLSRLLASADLDQFALSVPILRIIPGDKPVAIMAALERSIGMEPSADSAIRVKGSDVAFAVWRVDLVTGKGRPTERGARTTESSLRYWREVMGDPRTGAQRLIDASPSRRVGSDTAPILLFHGEQDTVVPIEQSRTMKQALAAVGRTDELVLLQGDDHYLSQSATRTRMLAALSAFLDRHLPVAP